VARDVVQSTIGLLGPVQDTIRSAKQRLTARGELIGSGAMFNTYGRTVCSLDEPCVSR